LPDQSHGRFRLAVSFCQNFKRKRQERIACEDSRRLIEGLMTSGYSSAQIIVIHCGQIIVHKRISMDHFYRGGCDSGVWVHRSADKLAAPEHQSRSHPLARRSERVLQRFS